MATTSLWHIEGRLKDLIAYVENPEKTRTDNPNLQPLWDIFSYVSRPEATEQGEYVSAVNCLKEIALQQMILTKKQYGKENGYIAWHGYQSFKPGEVTPEQAHQIGLQLAKEMWGDKYQIIVTTHLDKDHLHNHFCFNSVSFLDGRKYNYSKSEQRKLREVSDRICREHGLSVIENPHKAPSRQVWLDEKSGKPTRYNVYREDVKEAINFSRRPYYMEEYLRRKGYITDFTGKHWKIRLPQYAHFTRLDTLDERWTPEHIERTMGAYASFGNRRASITYPPQMPQSLRDWFKPFQKTSHIYRLYLHYCYLLGVLPKKTTYRPTSPYRLDRITNIKLLPIPAKPMEQVKGLEHGFDLPRHMAEHVYLFPGESGTVTFRAKKYLLNDIIDWFGGGVTFFDETGEEVSVRVRVNYAAMRRWALQYALHAKLLSPESLVKQVREDLRAAGENYKM